MENKTESNISAHGLSLESPDLPIYLSTHSNIPDVLIHEIAVVWMVTGMVFNSILIYYLVAAKKYRSPVFMLVLFLANADFTVCLSIACLAGFVWPVYTMPKHTWMLCKVVYYLLNVAASASPYYLLLFAALRFFQLCFPLKSRARVTCTFVRNWCLLIMCVTIVAWSPFLFSYDLVDVKYDEKTSVICEYTGHLHRLTNIAFLVVNTCIPGLSIPVLHIMKYIGVSRRGQFMEGQQEKKNTDIRALMIIIAMFYIGWIPMNIYAIVYKYLPNHRFFQDKLGLILMYGNGTNNTLNPLVYCLAASSVRSAIVRAVCKKKSNKTTQYSI